MKINFKKILLIIVSFFAGLALLFIGKAIFTDHSEKNVLNIDGKDYDLFTARTVLERTRGL
mgnify:FL=1